MVTPDPELLTDLFTNHLGRDVVVSSVKRGPVGNGQEVWFVDVEGEADGYVLRRTAPGGPLQWTDRDAEFRTLAAVLAAGLPVPQGLWHEPAGGRLEGAYFVMTRLAGDPGARAAGEPSLSLAADLGVHLARLHQAPLDTGGVSVAEPSAAEATRSEIAAWRERYQAERAAEIPMIDALLARLEADVPGEDDTAVLLWGDPGPHNALHDNGKVTGLLDWELSHVGDPYEDLGSLAWYYSGRGELDMALEAYEQAVGRSLDRSRIRYFEVMACVTRSIMLVNAAAHYVDAQTSAPNLAGLYLHLVPVSLLRAGRLLDWPEPTGEATEHGTVATTEARPDARDLIDGTVRFLRDQVLPATGDAVLRRGLHTTLALLATAALRAGTDPQRDTAMAAARRSLLAEAKATGVDAAAGFAGAVAAIESASQDVTLRNRVRAHLMGEVLDMEAAAGPLNDLYSR